MFKVNNRHRNGIIDCVMSSRQGRCSGVFIDNFEHISHLVLVLLLLTLNRQMPAGKNIYGTKVQLNLCAIDIFSRTFPRICAMRLGIST